MWTLRLDGFGIEEGDLPYRFTGRLETAPPPVPAQDDCGTGGDLKWTALSITPPVTCVGTFAWYDDVDG